MRKPWKNKHREQRAAVGASMRRLAEKAEGKAATVGAAPAPVAAPTPKPPKPATLSGGPKPRLVLSPGAAARLYAMAAAREEEVASIGVCAWADAARTELRVSELHVAKQRSTAVTCEIDMDWLADLALTLHAERGIEPANLRIWAHTHPSGVNGPSGTDEATMAEDLLTGAGSWCVMLILTKGGVWYARLDERGEVGGQLVTWSRPMDVVIPWAEPSDFDAAARAALLAEIDARMQSGKLYTDDTVAGLVGDTHWWREDGEFSFPGIDADADSLTDAEIEDFLIDALIDREAWSNPRVQYDWFRRRLDAGECARAACIMRELLADGGFAGLVGAGEGDTGVIDDLDAELDGKLDREVTER